MELWFIADANVFLENFCIDYQRQYPDLWIILEYHNLHYNTIYFHYLSFYIIEDHSKRTMHIM